MKLGCTILTKNQENNIVNCIESLGFCDEIVVVDDYSQDRTLEILARLDDKRIKVFQRSLEGDFSAQRNFALGKTVSDWVFFVDADEQASEDLAAEIVKLKSLNFGRNLGYFIKRRDVIWGKELKHGEVGNIKFIRLAKKDAGIWKGKVHEKWEIKGVRDQLRGFLVHFPHATISEFLQEVNFYSTLRAGELFDKKIKTSLFQIIFYPTFKFINNYFVKLGFMDGIEGFVVAVIMSFHSFLVRSKLWMLQK